MAYSGQWGASPIKKEKGNKVIVTKKAQEGKLKTDSKIFDDDEIDRRFKDLGLDDDDLSI